MTIVEFLSYLSGQGIKLWVENERLRYRAPQDVMTDAIRADISQRRDAILTFLRQTQERSQEQIVKIPVVPRDTPLPLSFAQERLWFIDQWQMGSAAYHVPLLVRLNGRLDRDALYRSITGVMDRHQSLRTTIGLVQDQPVQVIDAHTPLHLRFHDLRQLPQDEREAAAASIVSEETQQPFDLARGPLTRVILLQLAEMHHLLLVVMHHIITDGWSMHILTQELGEFYRSYISAETPLLAPLPIQYADFALWQRQWLQGAVLERYLSYWQNQLQGAPAVTSLPPDHPRPPVQAFRGANAYFTLSSSLTAQLKALAQQEDATLFMVLLTGFKCLLGRYSGQSDLVVGSPIANRTHAAIKGLIGFFVNMLVLRTDLGDNPRCIDALRRVKRVCLEGYAHQELPFERLVEVLHPERSMSYHPIVQAVFVLQNIPAASIELPELTLVPVAQENTTAKFDITLTMLEEQSGLRGIVEYNTDLFEPATIDRFIQHFQVLLQALVSDPSRRISELPLLSAPEQTALIRRWHSHHLTFPGGDCLHTRFEQHAARTPDAIAVSYEHQQITYGTLNARANQLADYLRSRGVGPETFVGLYVERSIEMIIAVLGILKAGGVYVPLDPMYPPERIAFILDDSRIKLLVTQQDLAAQLPGRHMRIVCLDSDWPDIAGHTADNVPVNIQPYQLAYAIYTSGSTGQPKGSLITHEHVARLFVATQEWFQFDRHDAWSLFHSIAFDFSVWELWGALLFGGRLVVVPYLTSRDPEAFARLVRDEQITVLNQTPSAFRQLSQADAILDRSVLPSALRLVIFGGEALEPQSLQSWFERYGDQQPTLVNMYGITETTVHVTYRPLRQADCRPGVGSVIGKPIPDLYLYLLDANGHPVPAGLPGELYVGGPGVARGYGYRPALTAERFVPDPFSGISGARLYRTGDLARETYDGDLEYLGRIDQQVKVRGFRIELGEIEAALQQYPALTDSRVILREDTPGERYLAAYIVAKAGASPSTSELRTFLKTRLPEYMIPAAFVLLPALPLTPHGKLDRRALPLPDHASSIQGEQFVPPSTPAEQVIAEIWAEVLGVQRVGIHDNFFALGGDSMRSVKVLSLARQQGLDITIQDLFQYQTMGDLARQVRSMVQAEPSAEPVAPFALIDGADRVRLPADVEDAYPITTLQNGMLFHSIAHPGTGVYHDIYSLHLRAPLNVALLRMALDHLAMEHAILRTSFDLVHYQQPLQLIHRSASIPLASVDLRQLPADAVAAAIDDWLATERLASFHWEQPPLLRCQIHQRTDDTFQFSVSFHHAILDGWSLASLFTELFQRYLQLLSDPSAALLATPDLAFREYVALELAAVASDEQRAYWLDKLQASSFIQIPCLSPGDDSETSISEPVIQSVRISAATSTRLHQLARRVGVPIKSVLLAAHLRVLAVLGSTTDVVTGLVAHGRPQAADSERVLGLFLNTVPFRLGLDEGTWADLIRQTFAAETELQPFIRYPMAHIQRLFDGTPFFEVIFNFTHFHVYQQLARIDDLQVLDTTMFGRTNFLLTANFTLDLDTNDVVLELCCDNGRITADQLDRMAGYYARVLEAMSSNPDQPHLVFSPIGGDEYRQLMSWGQGQDRAVDLDVPSIDQLFTRQVRRTPDHVAVLSKEGSITYVDLERRAEQLARHLRRMGVGPEHLVAVFLERSIQMVVAIMGIWKVGATYVPLDPQLPAARLDYILTDTRATVLLTSTSIMHNLPQTTVPVVCLDRDWRELLPGDDQPCAEPHPDTLAYVIYTSGSTGAPKGVGVSQGALVRHCDSIQRAYELSPEDRVLQFAALGFDVSIEQVLPPLLSGAGLVLADTGLGSPLDFTRMIETAAITVVNLPPIYWREWVQTVARLSPTLPSQLRLVIVGGDAFPAEVLELWQKTPLHAIRLLNGYGPTETTITATLFDLTTAQPAGSLPSRIPIGQPIGRRSAYILDRNQRVVPIGVPGELYLGGPLLARGYLNQPALTAERFVPDPFADEQHGKGGARLYRTGDLARWLPDGSIEFLGRIDTQVKLRGFRIELGEIEAVLHEQPAVQDAVVLLREDAPGDQQLVAYVVLSAHAQDTGSPAGRSLLTDQWYTVLRNRLPPYMVPSAFVCLDALPVTTSGKLDRRALPQPDSDRHRSAEDFVGPRDVLELRIAHIWETALGTRGIGVNDDFFALGGHSLTAMRVMASIEHEFETSLPLSTLLRGATISNLAQAIRRQRHTPAIETVVPIRASGLKSPFFCIHPAGGDVLCYQPLAAHLADDRPFYALQAVGLYGEQDPDASIEAMAARYLSALQAYQPNGPYYLGGWSLGGIVAFEVAQQLQAQGQEVAKLVLLDSQLSHSTDSAVENDLDLLRSFALHLGLDLDQIAHLYTGVVHAAPEEQLAYALEQLQQAQILPGDVTLSQLAKRFHVFRAHVHALQRYRPHPFDGHAMLVQAREQSGNKAAAATWTRLIEHLTICTAEGSHLTLLRPPHVFAVAHTLENYLDNH